MADEKVEENKTERVQLLMTPSEVKAIDDWSFENHIRGRAEAMRRLCQIGLGLEDSLKTIFTDYDAIGPQLKILLQFLREKNEKEDLSSWNPFFIELSGIVEKMFSHREALAELRHTTTFLKNVDWELAPLFSEASEAIRELRAERREAAKLNVQAQVSSQQAQED